MATPRVSDDDFIAIWRELKSASLVSKRTGVVLRAVLARRRTIENRLGIVLPTDDQRYTAAPKPGQDYPSRKHLGIENGTVLVFSDAHFWPGIETTAYRGLLWAIKTLKPKAIINNGDALDGAGISRHPRIAWAQPPTVIDEIRACTEALEAIDKAAKRQAKLIWTLGNHDLRFESRLANNAPEFDGVAGFKLCDHFPKWEICWSVWPTDHVVIKHRFKGGIHATHNNTLWAGKTVVTGHLHSLKVTPFSDYAGVRWGVDTGTLAETDGPQFRDYVEESPVNWRSGFAVLTFRDGKLLWPELAHRYDESSIEFRGQVIQV